MTSKQRWLRTPNWHRKCCSWGYYIRVEGWNNLYTTHKFLQAAVCFCYSAWFTQICCLNVSFFCRKFPKEKWVIRMTRSRLGTMKWALILVPKTRLWLYPNSSCRIRWPNFFKLGIHISHGNTFDRVRWSKSK